MAVLSALSLAAGMLGVSGIAPSAASAAGADAIEQATAAPLKGAQMRMAAGNPGQPSDPVLIFEEDFENRAAGSNVLVSDYVAADGTTYETAPFWGHRANCNGFIVDFGSTRVPGDCNGPGGPEATGISVFDSLSALPHALGQLAGAPAPETNAAAASYTSGSGSANLVQFATESPLAFSTANRFVTFSVDAAATNCHSTHPQLRFYLQDEAGTEIPVSTAAIDPCLDPRSATFTAPHQSGDATSAVRAGTFAADSSVLLTGESFGIVLRNENGNGAGNDGAYDNIRVLDVTPQLDKAFSPTSTFVDGISTLTFTVTNTSELAAKDGWAFTDALPAGLEVAATPNLGGDCVADTTAEPGGTSIAVANGVLATDEVSCTISVDVTSSQVGTYTNSAANVDEVGLNPPGEATVEFTDPADVTCVSDTSIFNTASDLNGGALPAGERDLNWQVGVGDASGYQSVASYEPAYVVPPVSGAWVTSPYGNADWISYNPNGGHPANIDLYFRYDFTISELVQLDGFTLPMDFYADNSVPEVWVNGVAQSQFEASLPQSANDPYFHNGFAVGRQASTRLSEGFQHGDNSIIVRVASGAPYAGFLAQILPEPVCADYGDAPESYGTTAAANGARHGVVPGLTLGSQIDADADGTPSPLADGDDVDGLADEDALTDDVVLQPGATSVTVPVAVTNEREAAATLHGWLDSNGNGTFEAAEATTTAVPGGATSVDLAFSGLAPAQDGSSPVLRLRLTTDELVDDPATAVDERALGVARDGEVEDHRAQVATLVPVSCVAPFVETFGAGAGIGPALPAGQTTYLYESTQAGGSAGYVQDGEYTVYPGDSTAVGTWWHPGGDHTGDPDGRMMLINASFDEGIFFQRTFTGLAEGGTYDFSAWITNANRTGSPIVPNVTFRVVDPASGTELARVDSGDIANTPAQVWEQFGVQFTAAQSTVRLELVNNAPGGNGNDLAIDDISFAPVCDFGDAPASYGTLVADEGAAHIPGATRLGAAIDVESDGRPSAGADGDDLDGASNDEDGVATPLQVSTGVTNTVTVSATNDSSEDVTLAGWIDLDANGAFDEGERATVTVPARSGTADHTLEFAGATTTGVSTYARFRIFGTEIADPQPTGIGLGGEVEDYLATVLQRELSIAKSSTFTADSRPGDVIEYTVTATNTGDADYVDAVPAVVLDDLAGVLDDAEYNRDAAAVASDGSTIPAPAFLEPAHLSWAGALAVGESVEITYSVRLTSDGDGQVTNVAWQPSTPLVPGDPPPATPDCTADADVPCASTDGELPRLTVAKSADTTDLPADGQAVTYEVTITNEGPGAFTEAVPATVTDDLSEVLDDATFDGILAPGSGATFDAETQQLTWTGPLAAGASVTIEYAVTYDETLGDNVLYNVACVPGGLAAPGADACAEVQVPAAELGVTKTVDPEDGTTVVAGQTVTYTLAFESLGRAAAAVSKVDDLSNVLDDATLVEGSLAVSDDDIVATLDGDRLTITGEVPVGETYTVTYAVVVDAFADQGDRVLANVVQNADGTCGPAGCPGTENEIRHFSVAKAATPTTGVDAGEVVDYTITVTNDGAGDYTAALPAGVSDDMSDVLDDATYNGDAVAVASDGSDVPAPTFASPVLAWAGPLATGESVEITFSVTVHNRGDHDLVNAATPVCVEGEACDPPTPPVEILVPHIVPSKTADPATGATVTPGQVITYTLSWTNDGQATGQLDSTDDLSDVLDDAQLTAEPVVDAAHADSVTAEVVTDAQQIRVTGDLAAGETATVTYQVTVLGDEERANNALRNVVAQDTPAELCDEDCPPPPATEHLVPEIADRKDADPASGTEVEPGAEVTYTLTFENLGEAAGTVDRVDDLTHVLDDADVTVAPAASDAALTVSAIEGGRFSITGSLQPGQTVTVAYTVTVKPGAELGDARLGNFLLDPEEEPPAELGTCEPADEDATCHVIPNIVDAKSVDVGSGTAVEAGQQLTYTLTFQNLGAGAGSIDRVDDLTHVLDDADVTVAPAASDEALTVSAIEEGRFSITGSLEPGQTVTVTYTVTVKGVDELGDTTLANFLLDPEEDVPGDPSACADGEDCTINTAPRIVDQKSVDPASHTSVRPGDALTYTLTFGNEGSAAGAVDRVDDLTHVLDDADVTAAPVASDDALTVSAIEDGRFSVTGSLEPGQTVTVTYIVTVRAGEQLGDSQLANFLLDPGATPPAAPVCAEGEDSTCNPVSNVTVVKSADPESGTQVQVGQQVTYTLTFRNEGAGARAIDYTDHMAGVLDDADLVDAPVASDDALTVSQAADGTFSVHGELAGGQTVTVAYSVQVRGYADQGDGVLGNAVTETGNAASEDCAAGSTMCTSHPVADQPVAPTPSGPAPSEPAGPDLPRTGADPAPALVLGALGLLLLAAGALLVGRYRRRAAEEDGNA